MIGNWHYRLSVVEGRTPHMRMARLIEIADLVGIEWFC
jgi:hypothetical protein